MGRTESDLVVLHDEDASRTTAFIPGTGAHVTTLEKQASTQAISRQKISQQAAGPQADTSDPYVTFCVARGPHVCAEMSAP
jgi:hypothetical protein